ncbi:hypothetical protein OPV22_011359 [Ensete ventricosum]|uniref:Uncharacterized protein n=1 Tax=Ensete ventricosum TaxID=4639 RepID=A0AAV8RN76_ENSVE|nr:hypothetical protein OPV22_011359 [Ensete ventricosum]
MKPEAEGEESEKVEEIVLNIVLLLNWFPATPFSVCEGFEVRLPSDIGHIWVLGFWIVTEQVRCLGDARLIWNTVNRLHHRAVM